MYQNLSDVIGEFIHDYRAKPSSISDDAWLAAELARHGCQNASESTAVIEGIRAYCDSRDELARRIERGESRTRYVHDSLAAGAKASGVAEITTYANNVDDAVSRANEMIWKTLHTKSGAVNQAKTVYGNLFEAEIAGSAAINQAANESALTTEQLRENILGGADTQVVDSATGEIVSQQQMKVYDTAEATANAYIEGGYAARGQCLIAPADQVESIRQLHPDIEVYASIDGHGNGITVDQIKKEALNAQENGIVHERGWWDADIGLVSKHLLGKTVESGVLAMGIQAAAVLGKRICNCVVGKPNKTVEEDLQTFAEDAIKAGAAAGLTTAVSGGLVVAARNKLLGAALAEIPAGGISAVACAAIENVKVLGALGRGEITSEQALDKAGDNTCALLGSMAVGTEWGAAGAAFGTAVLPGVGTAIGSVVGFVAGGAVGHTGGHAIYQGATRAVSAVERFVSNVASSIENAVSNAWVGFKSLFA